MQPQVSFQPTWTLGLLVLLGSGFVLGLLFKTLARRQYSAGGVVNLGWIIAALAGGSVALVLLGFVSVRQSFVVVHDKYEHGEHAEVPGHQMMSTPQIVTDSFDLHDHVSVGQESHSDVAPVQGTSFSIQNLTGSARLVLILLLGAGILTAGSAWKYAGAAAAPKATTLSSRPATGWLAVPLSCAGVLGYLAFPNLTPPSQAASQLTTQSITNDHARTDKIVRDLVKQAAEPDAEVRNIPDWLKFGYSQPHHYLLVSGQYSTREETEQELLPVAANLLQEAFHQNHSWQGAWTVPLAQVRERVVRQQFVERHAKEIGKFKGDIYRQYMLVNVSPDVCNTFTDIWKEQIVTHRLKILGVLLGWIAGLTLLGSSVTRLRSATALTNSARWLVNLKASAITAGLTAVAGWLLVTVIG